MSVKKYKIVGGLGLLELAMDKSCEERIKGIAVQFLRKGRPGDYEHTLRVVAYGKKLLEKEEGDEDIVIPTLYLHDIGWSRVDYDDFINADSPAGKFAAESVALHMEIGAGLAKTILEKLEYDSRLTRDIVSIIAVHDNQKAIIDMNNPSATLVFEADYLDKIGPESYRRMKKMFRSKLEDMDSEERRSFLQRGIKQWFRTGTAKEMSLDLIREAEELGLLPEKNNPTVLVEKK